MIYIDFFSNIFVQRGGEQKGGGGSNMDANSFFCILNIISFLSLAQTENISFEHNYAAKLMFLSEPMTEN